MSTLKATRLERTTAAAVAFAAAMAAVVFVPSPALAVVMCNGLPATIIGTPSSETIDGTAGPDVIAGLGGSDVINGYGGDDVICGDAGADTINGGNGADTLFGGDGRDTINGGAGADVITGGKGRDTANGGGGADILMGGGGDDFLSGGSGFDEIDGGFGNDNLRGGDGSDVIDGGGGNDTIFGGSGKDVIDGGGGADVIKGEGGDDVIDGGSDDDEIRGSNGADDIRGGPGADLIYAGAGPDVVRGEDGADTLFGGSEDDILTGLAGVDTLNGGSGTDDCAGDVEKNCEQGLIDFKFLRFYVSQAVPAADSAAIDPIELVAGRPGIVRGFFKANRFDDRFKPQVRLYWMDAQGATGSVLLSGPDVINTSAGEGNLNNTHNYAFDDTFLEPGMKFYIEIDGPDDIVESSNGNNRYPTSGWLDPGVVTVPDLDITFVPIGFDGGAAPSITQASARGLLEDTFDVHPVAGYDIQIRSAINFNTSGTFADWIDMLEDVRNLGLSEDPGRVYAGIVLSDPSGLGVTGIGYVNGPGFSTWPYSVNTQSPSTIAHELGHNLSLPHAPCGNAGEPDPEYPYPGGLIGSWGYESDTGSQKNPNVYRDVMTYCGPEWISDYNYANVLDFRQTAGGFSFVDVPAQSSALRFDGSLQGVETSQARTAAGAPGAELRVTTDSVTRVTSAAGGDHQLVGLDVAGNVVAAQAFYAYEVADTLDNLEVRHFDFTVVVANPALLEIVRWEIRDAFGLVVAARVS